MRYIQTDEDCVADLNEIQRLENREDELGLEVDNLTTENTRLRETLAYHVRAAGEMKAENTDLTGQLGVAKRNLIEAEEHFLAVEKERDEVREQFRQIALKATDLDNSLYRVKLAFEDGQKQLVTTSNENTVLKFTVKGQSAKIEKLREEWKKSLADVNRLRIRVGDYEATVDSQEKEKEKLQEELDKFRHLVTTSNVAEEVTKNEIVVELNDYLAAKLEIERVLNDALLRKIQNLAGLRD